MIECDWLKKWARETPNAVALVDADNLNRTLTYQTLFSASSILARELRETYRVSQGDRVAVLASNELEYVTLFFATQRLGAILVPINHRLAEPETAYLLAHADPRLIVHQTRFNDLISRTATAEALHWRFDGDDSLTDFLANTALEKTPDEAFQGEFESPCMILYTSGTTGRPKGAIVTNQMLFWNSVNTTLRLNLQADDTTLAFLPLFHTGGWNVLLTPFIHRGAKTVLMRRFDAIKAVDLCEQEKVSVLFGVPTTLDRMARTPDFEKRDLSSVRFIVAGGEAMATDLIHIWQSKGLPVRQGFGLTEFGPNVFSLNAEDAVRKIGSIGTPNFYVDARVIGEGGQDVERGSVGELILKGPVCTPGYWRDEESTREAIREGWMHTGDLVRQDDEGYFYVVGRMKDMFISGGENVYPMEIERCLSAHPAIREVAVLGVSDPEWGEVGQAYVVLHPDAVLSEEHLRLYCQEHLAKFKIPKHVEFRTALPKGESGKVLKRLLASPC